MRKAELALALALTAVSVWLHVTRACYAGPLWRDEAGAVRVALLPTFEEMQKLFQHEAFPLLFPLTVRGYAAIAGSSDGAMRIFGLLVGLSLLGAVWYVIRKLTGEVPLVSIALIGTSALFLQWGDNVRGYGLGTVAILVTAALLWQLATRPSTAGVTAAFVGAICSVHLLYYNAVSLLVVGLAGATVALRSGRPRRAILIVGIGAAAGLSLLPYSKAIEDVRQWSVIFLVREFRVATFMAKVWEALGSAGNIVKYLWLLALLSGVTIALAALILKANEREQRRRDAALFCLLVLLLSVPAYFGFLRTLRYPTQPWYYFALLALVAVAIEGAILALPWRHWRTATRLPLALTIAAFGVGPAHAVAHERQTNVDLVAAHLSQSASPDDVIIVAPWYLGVSFARYYKGEARWITLPPIAHLRIHRYDLYKEQMTSADPMRPIFDSVESTLSSGHRVWVVGEVVLPRPGEAPRPIAPAPHSRFGWAAGAYAATWNAELGYLVQQRALDRRVLWPGQDLQISSYEKVPVTIISGWRASAE